MINLKETIQACQNGKQSAQKQLYEMFAPKMFAVCLRYCKDRTEAEDCLQEGFIKVLTHIKSFRSEGSFEGWVRRIMVNTVIESFRKKQPITTVSEFPLMAVDEEENMEADINLTEQELMSLIQELPPKYRMVFNLYAIEGYTHEEISVSMGISQGTSKSNLSRARQWLKKRVEERLIEKKRVIC